MGEVYRAIDTKLDREVAIGILMEKRFQMSTLPQACGQASLITVVLNGRGGK